MKVKDTKREEAWVKDEFINNKNEVAEATPSTECSKCGRIAFDGEPGAICGELDSDGQTCPGILLESDSESDGPRVNVGDSKPNLEFDTTIDEVDPETQKFLEEYRPPSIDNPPRETGAFEERREAKQQELFNKKEHEKRIVAFQTEHPDAFEVDLKLTLKATAGMKKPVSIPVAFFVSPAERIEEQLRLAFNGRRFLDILRAVVGDPLVITPQPELFNRPMSETLNETEPKRFQEEVKEQDDDVPADFVVPDTTPGDESEIVPEELIPTDPENVTVDDENF